ncbi:alginate export family protein [Gilvimarinus sp. DA14]|uniref:alginate export family protein n=1 Tax=Gilvimarinus sp. DA14 TaxID=2956798 RepID=UPI0020B6B814|nr:alginate export family protein [Gilvimarinus sp. DA14]UTF59855.1 alginate export family protein [Gilvimarinus sp. DA14]
MRVFLPISLCLAAGAFCFNAVADSDYSFANRLTAQAGYGPTLGEIGSDEEGFGVARYAPSLLWWGGEDAWPKWEVYTRLWFSYSSNGASSPVFEDDQDLQEGESAEWRDFYLKVNRLFGSPGVDLTIGRQRYSSELGVWWDNNLESLKLEWRQAHSDGFIAFGSRLATYNSAIDELPESEEEILYGFGQWRYSWRNKHYAGIRLMLEADQSEAYQAEDPYDVDATRYGLFFQAKDLDGWFSDYYIDLIGIEGDLVEYAQDQKAQRDFSGWLAAAEFGKRFYDTAWRPRFALRATVSDEAQDRFDGYYLNSMESDRINIESQFRSAASGSLVELTMSNLLMYGVKMELQPRARQSLDVLITQISCRSATGVMPIERTRATDSCAEDNVGQTYDLNYVWDMYPTRAGSRKVDWRIMVNLSYFAAGSALTPKDSEYQALISTEINF